jgi:hypothetical protein
VDAILERLLRTEVPFDWMANNPVKRAAEIIATARIAGGNLSELKARLVSYQPMLHKELRIGSHWSELLTQLFEYVATA